MNIRPGTPDGRTWTTQDGNGNTWYHTKLQATDGTIVQADYQKGVGSGRDGVDVNFSADDLYLHVQTPEGLTEADRVRIHWMPVNFEEQLPVPLEFYDVDLKQDGTNDQYAGVAGTTFDSFVRGGPNGTRNETQLNPSFAVVINGDWKSFGEMDQHNAVIPFSDSVDPEDISP